MANEAELRALLAEAKGVIEGLDAIISGEVSKEWADFFGKDYEDMSACLSRITAALAEKDGGWIAVSERLPEPDKTVLVDGGIAYQRNGGWFSLTGIEYPGRLIQWNVTHWRPLPPLPTGE